jgi:uncharacterized RDD family membrane protein YckC
MSGEHKNAGLLLRTTAKILDFIIIAAVIETIPRAGYFAGLVYILIGDGLFNGRSIGKKLLKLRVVSSETDIPCSFKDSIIRNSPLAAGYTLLVVPWIGWIFFLIFCMFEFIQILGSKDGTPLGDEIAKTAVLESQ